MTAPRRPAGEIDWETIERVADEGLRSRIESLSAEEVEQELREAGFEPEEVDGLVQDAVSVASQRMSAPSRARLRVVDDPIPEARPPARRSRVVVAKVAIWMLATAVAAGFMVAWFSGRATPPPVHGPPHPSVARPAELRALAATACGRQEWATCEQALDEARAIDPEGERDSTVAQERRQIAAQTLNPVDHPPR